MKSNKRYPVKEKPKGGGRSPLSDVRNISRSSQTEEASNPEDSVHAVRAFNETAGKRKAQEKPEAGPGEQEGVSISGQHIDEGKFLSEQQLMDLLNLRQMAEAERVTLERDHRRLEELKRSLERAQQLEDRIQAPKLREFFQSGFIRQEIPIAPGEFEVVMRTIPARLDRIIQDMALEELDVYKRAKAYENIQISVVQLLRLSVAVESINGQRAWPHDVSKITSTVKNAQKDWMTEARTMIKENFNWWDNAEVSLATQLTGQFEAMVLRLRRQLDHVGLEKTTGN